MEPRRQNQVNKNKERAFVELAADVLKWSDEKKAIYLELVEDEIQVSGKLWEKIIAKKAKIKISDGRGYDFSDMSEAKTGCTRTVGKSHSGSINNMAGKDGWIRAAIYNHYKDSIDFFLLPPEHTVKCYFNKYDGAKGRVMFSYSYIKDTYANNMEQYRVNSYKDVCKKIGN